MSVGTCQPVKLDMVRQPKYLSHLTSFCLIPKPPVKLLRRIVAPSELDFENADQALSQVNRHQVAQPNLVF